MKSTNNRKSDDNGRCLVFRVVHWWRIRQKTRADDTVHDETTMKKATIQAKQQTRTKTKQKGKGIHKFQFCCCSKWGENWVWRASSSIFIFCNWNSLLSLWCCWSARDFSLARCTCVGAPDVSRTSTTTRKLSHRACSLRSHCICGSPQVYLAFASIFWHLCIYSCTCLASRGHSNRPSSAKYTCEMPLGIHRNAIEWIFSRVRAIIKGVFAHIGRALSVAFYHLSVRRLHSVDAFVTLAANFEQRSWSFFWNHFEQMTTQIVFDFDQTSMWHWPIIADWPQTKLRWTKKFMSRLIHSILLSPV